VAAASLPLLRYGMDAVKGKAVDIWGSGPAGGLAPGLQPSPETPKTPKVPKQVPVPGPLTPAHVHKDNFKDWLDMSEEAYNEAGGIGPGTVKGHKILKKYSGRDATVYENPQSGELTIAYRGTRIDRHPLSDLTADAALALGLEGYNSRFQSSDALYKKLRKARPKTKIHLTGHSLGGGEAAYVARNHKNAEADVFNPGIGVDAIGRTLVGERQSNIHIHRVPLDPLSIGSELPSEGDMNRYGANQWNVHGLGNFWDGYGPNRIPKLKPRYNPFQLSPAVPSPWIFGG